MNRGSKWYQTSRDKRPRRQCYQPLRLDEEIENDLESGIGDSVDSSINLLIRPELYVEKTLEPGDTLQALSLQFNCPVAELKRINHILRDNEIFARRKIKVPVKPGSAITEKLARVHSNNGANKNESTECANSASPTDDENDSAAAVRTHCTSDQLSSNSFDLQSLRESAEIGKFVTTPSSSSNLENENTLLDVGNSNPSAGYDEAEAEIVDNANVPFKCSGADWGLSWLQLFFCTLLLGFAGPLFYVLYVTKKKHAH